MKRFWDKVDRPADSAACWNWQGALSPSGYGRFWLAGKNHLAHRVAYSLANDTPLGDFVVSHSCDDRRCVNPKHLSACTQADNCIDMARKERGTQKLSAVLVEAVRQETGTQRDIARTYGIHQSYVSALKRGTKRKYLNGRAC